MPSPRPAPISYSGSAFIYFRDDSLNADDFFTGRVEPYQNRQYGGTFGGPIVKGRTHFFGSYERQEEPQDAVGQHRLRRPRRPGRQHDIKTNLYFARVDHGVTPNHQLSGKYNRFESRQPNSDVGGALRISNAITLDYATDRANVGLNSVLGARLVNQLSFTYLNSYRQFNRFTGAPVDELNGPGAARRQPAHVPVGDHWRPHQRRQRAAVLLVPSVTTCRTSSRRAGQHNMKFGGEFNYQYIDGIFANNSNGTFFYNPDPPNLATCCPGGDQSQWDKSQFPIPTRYTQGLGDYVYKAPNKILQRFYPGRLDAQPAAHAQPRPALRRRVRLAADRRSPGWCRRRSTTTSTTSSRASALRGTSTGRARRSFAAAAVSTSTRCILNLTFNQTRTNSGAQVAVTTFNTDHDPAFANDPARRPDLRRFQADRRRHQRRPSSRRCRAAGGLDRFDRRCPPVHADVRRERRLRLSALGHDAEVARLESVLLPAGRLSDSDRDRHLPRAGRRGRGGGTARSPLQHHQNYSFEGKSRYHGLQVGVDKRMSTTTSSASPTCSRRTRTAARSRTQQHVRPRRRVRRLARPAAPLRRATGSCRLPLGILFSGIFFAASGRAIGITTGGIDINGDGAAGGDRPICGIDPRFNPGCAFLGIPNGERVPRNPLRGDACSASICACRERFASDGSTSSRASRCSTSSTARTTSRRATTRT